MIKKYKSVIKSIPNLYEEKSFFTDSGIIEANYAWQYDFKNGEPVTVEGYHSTPHKFTKFKIGPVNVWGKGIYLTTNYKHNSYNPNSTQEWNHMRLYATFFKPFIYEEHISESTRNFFINEIKKTISKEDLEIINNKFQSLENYFDLIFKNLARTQYATHSSLTVTNIIQQLDEKYNLNVWKNLDIDGMILPFLKAFGESSDKDMEKTVWYVCYKTNQIKSYDNNNGDYDLNKEDINESVNNKLPNVNSLGQPITKDNNSLKNFWNWFKGSKVIDENNLPMVMYHGSEKDFNEFKLEFVGSNLAFGKGFYFTNDKSLGKLYSGENGKNYTCYINIKNPYIIKHPSMSYDEGLAKRRIFRNNPNVRDELLSKGYDGIMICEDDGYMEVVVFNPNQIKSIDNNGNWSNESNNINESFNNDFETHITVTPFISKVLRALNNYEYPRIMIDEVNNVYSFGDSFDFTHWDLIEYAWKQGYYPNIETNKELEQYLINNTICIAIDDNFNAINDRGADDYTSLLIFKENFVIYYRDKSFLATKLYKSIISSFGEPKKAKFSKRFSKEDIKKFNDKYKVY